MAGSAKLRYFRLMPHDATLISTIAVGLTYALIGGFIAVNSRADVNSGF